MRHSMEIDMKRHLRHLVASGMMALGLNSAFGVPAIAQSSVVDVPPPQVQDYWVSVSRQPGGIFVFDGYAPNAATRDALAQRDGADMSWLKLGSGAPATYGVAMTFGLSLLDRLSEGRFALRGSVLTVSGVAATQADFLDLHAALAAQAPQGLILAKSEISAPHVETYAFSVRRQANGNTILSGYVPDPALEQRLLDLVGSNSSSTLRFGSGEPLNFSGMLDKAMPLFALLQEGEIKLENGQWLLSGTPKIAAAATSIEAAFASDRLSDAGWSLALAAPMPAAPVEPYTWFAEKQSDGTVVMTGTVPTQALQSVLALRIGASLTDETEVLAEAPDGFIAHALAAADALKLLDIGKVGFDGSQWLIEGEGKSADASEEIAKNVASSGDDWSIAISAPVEAASTPAPLEVAAAPPVAEPQPATPVAEVPVPTSDVAEPAPTPATRAVETPAAPTVAAAPATPANIEQCRATLAELSAQNGILFRSGAAVLADGTGPILQSIADAIVHCPATNIDVAGHTDSDGEAPANLALSVARAEAVVNALIALGVGPERLYAIGYGESAPIADNATSAGKAQNRRIVVSVRDGD